MKHGAKKVSIKFIIHPNQERRWRFEQENLQDDRHILAVVIQQRSGGPGRPAARGAGPPAEPHAELPLPRLLPDRPGQRRGLQQRRTAGRRRQRQPPADAAAVQAWLPDG